jgi:hypothetical protein
MTHVPSAPSAHFDAMERELHCDRCQERNAQIVVDLEGFVQLREGCNQRSNKDLPRGCAGSVMIILNKRAGTRAGRSAHRILTEAHFRKDARAGDKADGEHGEGAFKALLALAAQPELAERVPTEADADDCCCHVAEHQEEDRGHGY